MRHMLSCLALLLVALPVRAAEEKRPMTIDDLFRFQRVADPQISPDGKRVVYTVTTVDLEKNQTTTALWLVPTDKGEPRQFTSPAPGKKDRHPRWSPDGKRILFESNRGGDTQLWLIDLDGSEARKLTDVATDAGNALWSRDGNMIAFVSAVYPENSEKPFKESNELNKKRQDEAKNSPVKAKTFDRLFFRHWDHYVEGKRQHLFVMPFSDGKAGESKDVTPGDRDAFPTSSTFATGENYTFSPDGKYLVFTAVPEKDEAWSTNYDICRVPVTGGTKEWETLTKDNPAADSGPVFSPDGKKLAYRAQKKAGYEADKWGLMIVDVKPDGTFAGKPQDYTRVAEFPEPANRNPGTALRHAPFDRSVKELIWRTDETLWFTTDWQGSTRVYRADTRTPGFGHYEFLHANGLGAGVGTYGSLTAAKDGKIAFSHATMSRPPEVFVTGKPKWNGQGLPSEGDQDIPNINLSHANDKLLAELELPQPESVTISSDGKVLSELQLPRPESITGKGDGGTPMQMWILKPPGFDPSKKWPLVYLVHGGPQSAWGDNWSFRWNPQLWAAQGFVVALPNPRGSTGFGQKYVDEIGGDWGGRCYRDLMAGAVYLGTLPYIDKDRMAAAGGSFGGYMMNWFAVNTGRFKTLITHCSVWNFDSMYATTDEIWFDEFEHGGPPWGKDRASYEKFSPHKYAENLGKIKTPMLVIHNDLDFRCPIGQGHELFTALKRQGVEARFLNFPDEGHWVLKPANSAYWHKEVFAWLKKYVAPGGR